MTDLYARLLAAAAEAVEDVLDSKPYGLAIQAVLALHQPYDAGGVTACRECSHKLMGEPFIITHPCPTVQALADELAPPSHAGPLQWPA